MSPTISGMKVKKTFPKISGELKSVEEWKELLASEVESNFMFNIESQSDGDEAEVEYVLARKFDSLAEAIKESIDFYDSYEGSSYWNDLVYYLSEGREGNYVHYLKWKLSSDLHPHDVVSKENLRDHLVGMKLIDGDSEILCLDASCRFTKDQLRDWYHNSELRRDEPITGLRIYKPFVNLTDDDVNNIKLYVNPTQGFKVIYL